MSKYTIKSGSNKRILILSGAIGSVIAFYYYSMMPAMTAIQFGFDGQATGFAGKGVFLLITGGLHIFLTALFYFTPVLLNKIPREYINLPSKEYWFAPVRQVETTRKIGGEMCLFGTFTNVFLIFCSAMSYQANLTENKSLDTGMFLAGLVVYLAVTAFWAYRFHRDFQRP
ncbi:MAG: DUF1648 domain-containing protein [FCB group bacterium]|nr:DUF1648 domain-containing protein [FCB group bacterium]